MRAPVLAVERLSVSLAGRPVLREISFSIEPGQFTGLIGSNGAGKTTLLRAILGMRGRASATSGRVLVGGAPRTRRNPMIGYVPQKVLLDPDVPLRARDLVALGLDGHRLGFALPSRRRRAQVEEMLDGVGARGFADARVGELSGGEQQRVLLAHALMGRPRLLLLDEPLANLDLRSVGEVVSLVSRIAAEQQLAVLISAHEINPLLPVMDRILYLAGGRAVHGTVDEVVRGDVLSELYGHPVDVLRVGGRVLVVAEVGGGAALDPATVAGDEILS
ncbi:MAG TPA: metal ABC transporter ATP-binding protein [Solirubrobacteraceae bacterium]|nr:metal ABC transporter ATP-binding protein [Solirubrobacteraceae bacterium]